MKFAKSVEVLLGLAASGGLVLVLSGNAHAADSSVRVSVQNHQETVESSKTVTPAHESVVVNIATESSQNTAGTTPVASSTAGENPASETVAQQPGVTAKSEVAILGSVDVSEAGAASAEAVPGVAPQIARNEVAATDSSAQTAEPVIRTVTLPMTSVVTAISGSMVVDLASMLPSAAPSQQAPVDAPAPTHQTGLFTRLTAVLASTVVPMFVADLSAPSANGAAMLWVVVVAVLIAFSTVVVNFVRRAGFAHAARSDAGSNLGFATPSLMSWDLGLAPNRSSFLMVW